MTITLNPASWTADSFAAWRTRIAERGLCLLWHTERPDRCDVVRVEIERCEICAMQPGG